MPDSLFVVLVAATWVSVGLAAVAFFLGRHGRRDWHWYAVGALLGPILLPIAAEAASPTGRLLRRSDGAAVPGGPIHGSGVGGRFTALVAVDGSVESDHAVTEAARLLGPGSANAVLLTVLDPDTADAEAQRAASELLRSRADRLTAAGVRVSTELAEGDPARVLLARAEANAVDLVVVGHRGRGLSRRLLGSVADQVVRQSPRPVLLGAGLRTAQASVPTQKAAHEQAHE